MLSCIYLLISYGNLVLAYPVKMSYIINMDNLKRTPKPFAEYLQDIIEKNHNMSQQQLADTLGVVAPYISRLKMKTAHPSDNLLVKISEEYKIDLKNMYLDLLYERTRNPKIREIILELINSDTQEQLSREDKEFIKKYLSLDEANKELIQSILDTVKIKAEASAKIQQETTEVLAR